MRSSFGLCLTFGFLVTGSFAITKPSDTTGGTPTEQSAAARTRALSDPMEETQVNHPPYLGAVPDPRACPANLESWTNVGNRAFYETLSVDEFRARARETGMESCDDLQQEITIASLRGAKSALDFGSGYGRVIDCILRHHKHIKIIHSVERAEHFVKYQRSLSRGGIEVHVHQADILHLRLEPEMHVDRVLWMWSGFAEFNHNEQLEALVSAATVLNPGGQLIIDLASPNFRSTLAVKGPNGRYATIPRGPTNLNLHLIEERSLFDLALQAGLRHIDGVEYETRTDPPHPRRQYIFERVAQLDWEYARWFIPEGFVGTIVPRSPGDPPVSPR